MEPINLLKDLLLKGEDIDETAKRINMILSHASINKEEAEEVRWSRKQKTGKIRIYIEGRTEPITVVFAEIKFSDDMVREIVKQSCEAGRPSILKSIRYEIEYIRSDVTLLRDRVGDIPLEIIRDIQIEKE